MRFESNYGTAATFERLSEILSLLLWQPGGNIGIKVVDTEGWEAMPPKAKNDVLQRSFL